MGQIRPPKHEQSRRMEGRPLPPLTQHLKDWTPRELIEAADAVRLMRESPGWAALTRAVDDRLRAEQIAAMRSTPHGESARHERMIGQWAGLTEVAQIAEGIVRLGEEAEREQREAA